MSSEELCMDPLSLETLKRTIDDLLDRYLKVTARAEEVTPLIGALSATRDMLDKIKCKGEGAKYPRETVIEVPPGGYKVIMPAALKSTIKRLKELPPP